MAKKNPVISYYKTFESRLGYRLLHGVKHFGYYPKGQDNISKDKAQLLMNNKLAETLGLKPGSRVLDAGCGEGGVAFHLHEKYGLDVRGIDLLDFNIKAARRNADQHGMGPNSFQVGSYMNLPYEDDTFDGLYTMETLVHAPDYQQALAEFHRVLKPGGKLALFEYALDLGTKDTKGLNAIYEVNKYASMPALNEFEYKSFNKKLNQAGFEKISENDITPHIMPMLKSFHDHAKRPYALIKMLGLKHHFVNIMSAVEFYEHPAICKYVIVSAVNKK